MSKLIQIKDSFFEEVNKKPSWGREQIKDLYRDIVIELLTKDQEDEQEPAKVSA
jgi:hypothetical protein